jgi:hypothetical protein
MNGVDKDFFCPVFILGAICEHKGKMDCNSCTAKCHKWPNPEQFKKEYGREYPDDGLVWYKFPSDTDHTEWHYMYYADLRAQLIKPWCKERDTVIIICACTPWGKPPDGWRPE